MDSKSSDQDEDSPRDGERGSRGSSSNHHDDAPKETEPMLRDEADNAPRTNTINNNDNSNTEMDNKEEKSDSHKRQLRRNDRDRNKDRDSLADADSKTAELSNDPFISSLFSVANGSRISQIDDATKARDGLFISKGPVLGGPLLHSEGRTDGVDDDEAREEALGFDAIGNTSGELHKIKHSARITQRLLRDLASECREGKLRELWQNILLSSPGTASLAQQSPEDTTTNTYSSLSFLERNPFYDPRYPAPGDPLEHIVLPKPVVPPPLAGMPVNPKDLLSKDRLVDDGHSGAATGNSTDPAGSGRADASNSSAAGNLTAEANAKLDVAGNISVRTNAVARFDIINDPVDESTTQVLMPECSRVYGGSLGGQWGVTDLGPAAGGEAEERSKEVQVQKLGHTIGVIDRHSRPRSVLKVRANQLSLLEHPYLNQEERLYIDLKRVYAHYRALFEHRSIFYLCHRLVALLTQMRKMVGSGSTEAKHVDAKEEEEEEEEDRIHLLNILLKDFSETLPLLMNVQQAMSSLSNSVYETWKELKRARKEYGCVCSKAVLVVRELNAMNTSGGGGGGGGVGLYSGRSHKTGSAPNSRPTTPGAGAAAAGDDNDAGKGDGADKPLLRGRGGKPKIDGAASHNSDNSDEDDEDDEENYNHLSGDVVNYREELRVFRQFVKLLDDDISGLVKSIQKELFVAQKAHIEAVALQEQQLRAQHADLRRGRDLSPRESVGTGADAADANSSSSPNGSFHHHAPVQNASVEEQIQALDARDERLLRLVENAVRDLRHLARNANAGNSINGGAATARSNVSVASGGMLGAKAMSFFPNVVFKLTNTGMTTPDKDVSIVERKRRIAIACTELTLKLRVNGEQLSQQSTTATVSYPSLAVHFNKTFELHVYHRPADLCLDVYLRLPNTWAGLLPSSLSSTLIASVGVPLPMGSTGASDFANTATSFADWNRGLQQTGDAMMGDARVTHKMAAMRHATLAAVYTPCAGWLMFASREPISCSSIYQSSFNLGHAGFSADPVHLQGAIYCIAEYSLVTESQRFPLLAYEGIHRNDLGLMPSANEGIDRDLDNNSSSSGGGGSGSNNRNGASAVFNFNVSGLPPAALLRAAGSLSANTRSNLDSSFARERDFQKLLPSVDELDVYDPRNESLLAIIQASEAEKNSIFAQRDVFRLYGQDYSVVFEDESGVGYSNFMKLAASNRMKLLQLRDYKPHLFTAPIPLSEDEIRSSELYRGLLGSIVEDKAPPNLMLGALSLGETQGHGHGGFLSTLRSQNRLGSTSSAAAALLLDDEEEDDDLADPLVDSLAGHSNGHKITNFMERVRDVHLNIEKGRSAKKQSVSTGDVVAETDYHFEFEFFELEKIIPSRIRALKPTPKVRTPQAMQIGSAHLLVQVVGCKNVPLRMMNEDAPVSPRNRRATTLDGGENTTHANFRGGNVSTTGEIAITNNDTLVEDNIDTVKRSERKRACTFVEVIFQENSVRTTSIAGSTPFWKQTLSLPFRPPQNDFAPAKLQQVREVVNFAVFDEIIENDKNKGGYLEGESTIRVERRYLGYISIPFLTIYETGRIDGVFRLKTPIFNFGYEHRAPVTKSSLTHPDLGMDRPPSLGDAMSACMGGMCGAMGVHTPMGTLITQLTGGLLGNFEQSEEDANGPGEANIKDQGVYMHSATKAELQHYASDSDATYIKLMLTMDPLLATSGDMTIIGSGSSEGRSSASQVFNLLNEDKYLGAFATQWLQEVQTYASFTLRRSYRLFGTTSSGQKAFMCRYLCPQSPPPSLNLTTRRSLLHFVSLVPFIPDSQVSLGSEVDLWCTTRQCLEMGAGDEEEHAILLHNYLLYLATQDNDGGARHNSASIEIYLALGAAIPEGEKTVYILLRDKNKHGHGNRPHGAESFLLINPCEGYVYSAADPNCPMQHITTLIACDNVYGNIQAASKPNKLIYDMLDVNSTHWRPFFGSRFEYPRHGLSTIQAPVEYFPTSQHYANDIEKAVRQAVKTSMRRWRSRRQSSATTFHPDASATMHDILPMLEDYKRTGRITDEISDGGGSAGHFRNNDDTSAMTVLQSLVRTKMKSLLKTRTLRGYPLNMAFTDIDNVIDQVKAVCVHEIKAPDVQYVLAVRAFPLVNNLVSLWIFLGSLETSSSSGGSGSGPVYQ